MEDNQENKAPSRERIFVKIKEGILSFLTV